MIVPRLRALALAATAALAAGGCSTYDDYYGYGYGRSYYGSGYGYSPYGYRSSYGSYYTPYGYATPYYGWYNNYYYPGVGVYIYDRSGSRYRWNDTYRNYWESRRGTDYRARENWDGYRRDGNNWRGRQWDGNRRRR
jgi:hypothetical protein